MRRNVIFAVFAAVVTTTATASLAACATAPAPVHYSLLPVRSNGQDLKDADARTTLVSLQPGSIVSVRGNDQLADFGIGFVVAVQNKGAAALDFGPKNIQASIAGRDLPVLLADDLDARVKAQMSGYLKAVNRASAPSIEAASAEAEREYRFNNFGGCPAGQSGCQIYSEDNGSSYRQDRLNREYQASTIAEAATALQASQALIERRALRASTIAPNEMTGGIMVVELPRSGGQVDLAITLDGRKHSFTFNAAPKG